MSQPYEIFEFLRYADKLFELFQNYPEIGYKFMKEVAKIYYKKYEDYDLAVAAADADDPYEALLEDLDLEV